MKHSRRDSGLMLLDAITGMAILGMLLAVMASAMSHHRLAANTLETQRRLDRLAEGVLTDLQQGKVPVVLPWETEIEPSYTLTELPDPGPCDGWIWAEVVATHEKREASIIGAVPEQSLALTGGTP